ncbi:MAG: ABC transporter substrate-binding protein, partial [Actinomycetota bacterium]|nr:ABC transporter substrate-binding protein [Actinomycetota bacterium]
NGDPGALINAAGVGVLATTDQADAAETFVDYLTGDKGQRYFAEETFEYPVARNLEPSVDLLAQVGFL